MIAATSSVRGAWKFPCVVVSGKIPCVLRGAWCVVKSVSEREGERKTIKKFIFYCFSTGEKAKRKEKKERKKERKRERARRKLKKI